MPWHLQEDHRADGPRKDSPIDRETSRLSENIQRLKNIRTREKIIASIKAKYERYHYHKLLAAAEIAVSPECKLAWPVKKTILFVLGEKSAKLDLPDLFEVFVNLESEDLQAFFRKIIYRKTGKLIPPKMLVLATLHLCCSRLDFKDGSDPRVRIMNALYNEAED